MKRIIQSLSLIYLVTYMAIGQEIVLKGQEMFGDMKARQIGPALMSGRVIDIEAHPTNDRIIYVGSAGGGVWKSANGGATFSPIFDQYNQSIGKVKVDPKDPDVVVKGGLAIYLFDLAGVNNLTVLCVTTLMWLLNFVLPSVFGSYYVLNFNINEAFKTNPDD